ncbi:succinate dehydrogenase and fumarate reductase iron-sulfur protein [Bifidobacterium callitrichos DSM 23973]|uniref:succinate dehydrogenase n=1 Tax=Bifidobacterium callitrichos DSM 23973 TaxID=1437609 RepID=A0A087A287_9BIFI|nr:succinate dehydrogenase and fumarate reductase iron-sulfur protein [Bifidobacterium callitrichos DSM 23973]
MLDCLMTIKRTVDPTLAFRYSCGHGMCGSDAVSINGTPNLLCTATLRDWAKRPASPAAGMTDDEGFRHTGEPACEPGSADDADDACAGNGSLGVIELGPLPGFPVQRDLIADIDPMLDQIRRLRPYLEASGTLATTKDGKVDVFEYLQRPDQLARYEQLSNCIACGVCEGSCPVFAGGDAFIGPAALIWASRFINDSRDTQSMARMDAIDTADGVAACQSVRACTRQCPRGIDVGEEMWQIVAKVRER